MKIVNITGGLGNQMFQYAFAVMLKSLHKEEKVLIDIGHYNTLFFRHFKGINLHNGFELFSIFKNANIKVATPLEIAKVSYYVPNYVLSRIVRKYFPIRKTEYVADYKSNYLFDKQALEKQGNCYYEGYWQCAKYYLGIKDELCHIYKHPTPNSYNERLISEISERNSVGIHIRRGDYLYEPDFKGICDLTYYQKAIEHILKDGQTYDFYIFSNDINWCKTNISPLLEGNNIHFITENTGNMSCWDMFLMTYCKHLIIANSSFSWWGAFLNKRAQHIICPCPWINRDCEIDIYDPSWIKI